MTETPSLLPSLAGHLGDRLADARIVRGQELHGVARAAEMPAIADILRQHGAELILMVGADRAQRALVDRAAARNIAVHAWTVNDAALVAPLVDQGVANIITDDPVLIRARLDEVRNLGPTERLLLRVRNELVR